MCLCARHLLDHGPNELQGHSSIPGLLMNSQAYASDLVTLKPTPFTRPDPSGFDTFKLPTPISLSESFFILISISNNVTPKQ